MALPPLWKIRRELNRIRVKTRLFLGRTLYDPTRKPIYDWTAQWRVRLTPGPSALTDRVVVFVVYQPKGVAKSILLTLDHLRRNDYSVIVVSNGGLRSEDRSTLVQKCALLMERPNVGYDFGAYRDGIRQLWSLNQELSRLILMNDSTWFPLRSEDDTLARMEALEADLAGHIFKTEREGHPDDDHMEAHMLMISQDFLKSSDFRNYWSSYRMSDQRDRTIAIGEKAFSQLAIKSGRFVRALMDREWLLSVLKGLDDRELERVLRHTNDSFSRGEPELTEVRRHLQAGRPWREAYLAWCDASLRNSLVHLLSAAFVMPAMVYGQMGFAKKAKDIRFHMAREELLDLEAMRMIPPLADEVRAEMAEMVRAWVPPRGHESIVRPPKTMSAQTG